MENLVALTCPNCGAATTNHRNCEYCNSLLVRFVDKKIEINQLHYGNEAKTFEGMEQVLEAQYNRMIEGREDIYCSIINGFNGEYIIGTASTHNLSIITTNYDYRSNGIAVYYTIGEDTERDNKFSKMDFFPLFTPTENREHYWINFGKDFENASKILYRLIVELFDISPNIPLEYQIWSYKIRKEGVEYEIKDKKMNDVFLYEEYRGGINEALHKTFENNQTINEIEDEEEQKIKRQSGKSMIYAVLLIIAGLFAFYLGYWIGGGVMIISSIASFIYYFGQRRKLNHSTAANESTSEVYEKEEKSWFAKNWWWLLVGIAVLLAVLFGMKLFNGGAQTAAAPSETYAPAVAPAPAEPEVQNKTTTTEQVVEENSENNATEKSYFAKAKSFFYNEPNENTIRKAYLGEGDVVYITKIQNGYGYTVFTNTQGQETEGWIKMNDMQVNTVLGKWSITPEQDTDGYGIPSITLKEDGSALYNFSDDVHAEGKYIVNNDNVYFTGFEKSDNFEGKGNPIAATFIIKDNTLITENGEILKQ